MLLLDKDYCIGMRAFYMQPVSRVHVHVCVCPQRKRHGH